MCKLAERDQARSMNKPGDYLLTVVELWCCKKGECAKANVLLCNFRGQSVLQQLTLAYFLGLSREKH